MVKPRHNQLPSELIRKSSRREVLNTLLLTTTFLIILNTMGSYLLQAYNPNLGERIIKKKWEMVLNMDPVETLILGDSSCNQGIKPQLLDSILKTTSANLCTVGGVQLIDDLWMLQVYIERHGPPKRVLIGHVYDVWHRAFDGSAMALIPYGLSQVLSSTFEASLKEKVRYVLKKMEPSLHSKNESLAALIRQNEEAIQLSRVGRFDDQGYMKKEVGADKAKVRSDLQGHLSAIKKTDLPVSKQNREALEEIVVLAQTHQFEVYLVSSPLWEGAMKERLFKDRYNEIADFLKEVASRSPAVETILTDPMLFTDEEMQNIDHVTDGAATKYTVGVAEAINERELQ
jgi:hypothetical protein